MWRHLLIVLLGTATLPVSQVTAVKGLMYMRQVDAKFHDFLSSGDNVKVVYFCKGICCDLCAMNFVQYLA